MRKRVFTKFDELLNRMEFALNSRTPITPSYAARRRALTEYVRALERKAAAFDAAQEVRR